MKKIYIAIIGKMAAGKGTFGEMLRQEVLRRRAPIEGPEIRLVAHRFSDPINDILKILYLPQKRENQQVLSKILREHFGGESIGRILQERAKAADAEIIILDGVRRSQDVAMLRGLPNSYLVAIKAPMESRFEWLRKRNDRPGDAEKTWEEFMAENEAESESKIDEIIKEADIMIDNSGTIDDLRKQARDFLQKKIGLVL